MHISTKPEECPTCGEMALYRVRRDMERGRMGVTFVVSDLEFEECEHCGEILFDPRAMDRIKVTAKEVLKRKAG